MLQDSPATNHFARQPHPATKEKKDFLAAMTVAEEDKALWLEDNEFLYNKRLNAFKDFRKKDSVGVQGS